MDRYPNSVATFCLGLLIAIVAVVPGAALIGETEGPDPFDGPDPVLREYREGLSLNIYLPEDHAPGDRRTGMIWVHGGGWGRGSPELMDHLCRFFAARGAVTIAPYYRLTRQDQVTVFECVADIRAAVAWVRQHADELGIDPDRIVLLGDSAGGPLAACAGIVPESPETGVPEKSRPNALVLFNAVLDTVPRDGWDLSRQIGEVGDDFAARSRDLSPMHHIASGAPPTLLLHGDQDRTTPLEWSVRFAELMEEAGNTAYLRIFENKAHAFIIRGRGSDAIILKSLEDVGSFLHEQGMWAVNDSPSS